MSRNIDSRRHNLQLILFATLYVCLMDFTIWIWVATFSQGMRQLEYLILNDCIALNDISPISLDKNLTFLLLNRVVIHEGELLQSVLPLSNLFFLGVKGNELSLESLKEMCKTLCKLSVLNLDLNTVNWSEFLSLASEFDITVNNT